MIEVRQYPLRDIDEDLALKFLSEETARETGSAFFASLVRNLAATLGTDGAWVTEYLQESQRLRAMAFWMMGEWIQDYEVAIQGTPCELVIKQADLVHIPNNIMDLFPLDEELKTYHAVSYMGIPLKDVEGNILGHLAVIDSQPLPKQPRCQALFQIFADRAAAELKRIRAENEVRQQKEQLSRILESAMDAVIKMDGCQIITFMNPSAEKIFGTTIEEAMGKSFREFITQESSEKLFLLQEELQRKSADPRYLWISGGLQARRNGGDLFPAEATLSSFEMDRRTYYTLILRNVNERIKAEKKIHSLQQETEYLKEELKTLHNFEEIIGKSQPLLRIFEDMENVAVTDATVLILGESGTGKELVARAIHNRSRRKNKPLIKVNCAAIPASLIESEFFGHEQGAFTGATKKRDGRFKLADRGTIFLDEIGELPLDLQGKLLRVLQEGEFEPVGSCYTQRVDVRIIAATNRDLFKEVNEGKFREDLYYRLNVFPIQVPPLRERPEDIHLLASHFAQQYAQRLGRKIQPLSQAAVEKLRVYHWPGNIRELQNVIERAVITSVDGELNLERALPEIYTRSQIRLDGAVTASASSDRIFTVNDLQQLEKENILRVLASTNWKISGDDGAANLLGMKPTTLSSRMKALKICRPDSDV